MRSTWLYGGGDFIPLCVECSSDFSPCFESDDIEFVWSYISDLIKDGVKQYQEFIIYIKESFSV